MCRDCLQMIRLSRCYICRFVRIIAHTKHKCRIRFRKTKLYMIARVMEPASQIYRNSTSIGSCIGILIISVAISSPVKQRLCSYLIATHICIIKIQRVLKQLCIVIINIRIIIICYITSGNCDCTRATGTSTRTTG